MPNTIHREFEVQAKARPNAVEVQYGNSALSYGDLNARANYLAEYLQKQGVTNGDVVALNIFRSTDMAVAMLAILKCGAAYLPLDYNNPASRNIACLEVAQSKVIISDRDCGPLLLGGRVVISTEDRQLFTSKRHENVDVAVSPDDKCYIMFTSGSTGDPKGVVVPHRAVVRLVKDTNYISVCYTDRVLHFSPQSFDASTFEIWAPLLNGGGLVIYSGSTFDPNLFAEEIRSHQVSIMWLTAALFHLIGSRYISALAPVKTLLAGGDVLYPKVVNKVIHAYPEITLINGYGPTENTTFTCCHRMTKDNLPEANVPIGKPISGTQIHILNENYEVVSDGEVGELHASGRGVSLGYLNSDANSDAFYLNGNIAEGLIYKTGDLVRRNEKGEVEFIGRKDNQIKIRGFRVSIEEIQNAILKNPLVNDAVVSVRKFDSGDQQLIAYLQLDDSESVSVAEIKRSLSSDIPKYMIPDLIHVDEKLPINNNGKIDRKKIREREILA